MSYIDKIQVSRLDNLCCDLSEKIYQHSNRIDKLLQESDELQGLGSLVEADELSPVYSFNEADEMYNSQISFEEKQAWVWYKQSLGIPMYGWEKYFLTKSTARQHRNSFRISDMVYATKNGTLLDNHFRPLGTFVSGQLIGKLLKKSEHGELGQHLICRNQEGIVIVKKVDCEIQRTTKGNEVDEKQLHKLVMAKALFYHDGEYLPYPIYSFANMYDRQLQLQKDKDYILKNFGQAVYDMHFAVCHKTASQHPNGCKPEVKSVLNPDERYRPFISPISSFATEEMEFNIKLVRDEYMTIQDADETTMVNGEVRQQKKAKRIDLEFDGVRSFDLQTVFVKWLYSLNETDFDEVNAAQIADYYIRNKALRDDSLSKEEKQTLKAQTRNEGDSLFQRFLHEVLTYEDQQKLDFTWNRIYNGQSSLRYNRIPIAFEISRIFKSGVLRLTDMQREAIGFLEITGNGIVSLDVGGGKTMIMIISLAMGMQQGRFSRPVLVLPKPVYDQFLKEMQGYEDNKTGQYVRGVLSGTDIKFNEWSNLGTRVEKKLGKSTLNKKVSENTITVVTKEAIKKFGFTDSTIYETMPDLVEIHDSNMEGRDGAKSMNKILEMIGGAQRGSILDFDVLGFDALYADEAHAYKNIFSGVKPDRYDKAKRYDLTGAVSDFGIRFFFLAHYIQRKYNRNVVMATATPFQKAILEIYSMLSLVSFNEMKRNNIINIKRFCDLFIRRDVDYVATMRDTLELKEVIKSFVNADILRNMINSVVYYRSKENFTNVKLPCKVNLPLINTKRDGRVIRLKPNEQIVTYLKMSKQQAENQKVIIAEIRNAYKLGRKAKKAAIFRGLANSLKNAFSPFDYQGEAENYKDFVENSAKIHACVLSIKSVKEYTEANNMKMPGQIIYANRGKQYFVDIKQYLDKELGFKVDRKFERSKVDEVEIITSNTSANRKETIKAAFNKGICKVIIGTSTIQEGLNLQQHATDIHVINTEWNPTALVQLAGRIHRQGNPYGYVRFTVYLLQDSIDVFMFQKNEEKISRINELMERGGQKVIDGDTIDANEIKYSLITDINLIVKMDYDKERGEAEKEIKKMEYNLGLIREVHADINYFNNQKQEVLSKLETFTSVPQLYEWLDVSDYESSYKAKRITKAEFNKHQKRQERAVDIHQKIGNRHEMDDKELLKLCRSVIAYQKLYDFAVNPYYNAGYSKHSGMTFYAPYAGAVSKILKAEKTILNTKGYDRNSDFNIVVEQMYKEIKEKTNSYLSLYGDPVKHEADPDYYKETKAYKYIYAKVNEIKNDLNIAGKTPQDVAKEFARLNPLLKYTIDNRPCGDECCIPGEIVNDVPSQLPYLDYGQDEDIELLELEAEAEIEMLNLLNI